MRRVTLLLLFYAMHLKRFKVRIQILRNHKNSGSPTNESRKSPHHEKHLDGTHFFWEHVNRLLFLWKCTVQFHFWNHAAQIVGVVHMCIHEDPIKKGVGMTATTKFHIVWRQGISNVPNYDRILSCRSEHYAFLMHGCIRCTGKCTESRVVLGKLSCVILIAAIWYAFVIRENYL